MKRASDCQRLHVQTIKDEQVTMERWARTSRRLECERLGGKGGQGVVV